MEELKHKLAEQFRGSRPGATGKTAAASTMDISNSMSRENFNYLNGSKKGRSGRSKSPGGAFGGFDEIPERGSAVKDSSMSNAEPAWYRALKKNK